MKARISELMDGELDRREAAGLLEALGTAGEAREHWRRYHLIGDAMRGSHMLSAGFKARIATRLAQEPTVIAPMRIAPAPQRRWQLLPFTASLAASLAAVALVGWVAFGFQEGMPQVAQSSQAKKTESARVAASATPVPPPAAHVSPPDAANDYLYAHQGYSPRNSLQGVAPYVRMASGEAGAGKR